jgi:hypothetical protein
MGPCIVRYRGGIYDQQDATNSQFLYLEMLYMFRIIIAHHQELGTVCAAVRCYKLWGSLCSQLYSGRGVSAVGPTGPISTTTHTHRPLENSTTHPKLTHRSTKTSDPHATTQRIAPPPKHRARNIADWRENLTTYNTAQLHIQFRAPDDGQWWSETCTAFLTIKIVNLSHLVGHIYHLYDILQCTCFSECVV